MSFKDTLRAAMAAQNINPEGLAVRLQDAGHSVSYSSVICWYYGRRVPDLPRAKALADVLGMSLDELAKNIGYPIHAERATTIPLRPGTMAEAERKNGHG